MGIYSNYIIENNTIDNSININDITEAIEKELDNFNKICESINILSENNIISESIDISKIKEKIKEKWEAIKKWFKDNVITKIKVIIKKIKDTIKNHIDTINLIGKNKKYSEVKIKAKEAYNIIKKVNNSNYNISDKEIEDLFINNIKESYIINESSKEEMKKMYAVAKMIRPQLFFKADNYIDFNSYENYFKSFTTYISDWFKTLAKNNPENNDELNNLSNDENQLSKSSKFTSNIKPIFKGILKNFNISDINKITKIINEDLESRIPESISITELISMAQNNIKNAYQDLSIIQKSIDNMNNMSDEIDNIIKNNLNKFSTGIFGNSVSAYRNNANLISKLFNYCESTYATSASLLLGIKTLNSVL